MEIPVRFIRRAGDQNAGIPPEFFDDDGTSVIVTECLVRRIKDLTLTDLIGMAPDTATPELVRYHIGTLYDIELPDDEFLVTIWRFRYV
jgi:hypothetical protein